MSFGRSAQSSSGPRPRRFMTPGRMLSTSTSAWATSLRAADRSPEHFRSSEMPRLLRLTAWKTALSFPIQPGPNFLPSSPSGGSTLMTSAPISPLGHMTGFAAGMLLGLKIGASVIFQDVWEPKRGIAIMADEGVTYSAGAATFLADMCEAVAAGAPKPARLRKFLCAGAPIPPALIDRVYRELDLKVCSLLGITESLSTTLTKPERPLEKSSKTDGRPLEGVAVKVLRMDGSPAAVGEKGLLKVRS